MGGGERYTVEPSFHLTTRHYSDGGEGGGGGDGNVFDAQTRKLKLGNEV